MVHAVADSELGPYAKVGVVVASEAHNLQVLLWHGKLWLFHIGTGTNQSLPKACNESLPPSP